MQTNTQFIIDSKPLYSLRPLTTKRCKSNMFVFLFNAVLTLTLVMDSMAILDKNLIIHFLQFKSIQSAYIFDCLPILGKLQLTKFLMEDYLRISVKDVKQNLALINNQLNRHYGIIVDGDCAEFENVLKQAGNLTLFDDIQHWLITTSNDSMLPYLINLPLNINSNLYVAVFDNINKSNWAINDVYNPAYKHGGALNIQNVGHYNALEGFKVEKDSNKYWLRKNMTGVTFKSMTVIRQVLNMTIQEYLYCHSRRKIDSFTRFQCRLIQYCSNFYDFNMVVIPIQTWGYEVSKGRFDGLTGALQNKEVDFGCTALYMKAERIHIIDYAVGLWTFRDIFIFRQPPDHSFGRLFFRPMSSSVWISTLAAAVLILLTLKLSQKHEVNIVQTRGKDHLGQQWGSLIIFVLGAICQQGCHQYPSLICGRIITILLLAFCLLFYQFYSGTVVSFLLTKTTPTIKTPQDLIKSSLEVGSDSSPYIQDYFRTTKDPIAIELYQKKIVKSDHKLNYLSPEHGLKLVEKGGFAYQVEITQGYSIINELFSNQAVCEMGEVEMFPRKVLLSVLQKNSPFRDMMNYCMLRLVENGIGSREKVFWSAQKPKCIQSPNTMKIEVGLKQIYPAIMLLFVGIIMSLIVLTLEISIATNAKCKRIDGTEIIHIEYPFYN